MDAEVNVAETAQTAALALDSAKSAHKRLDSLEKEVKDIRGLTVAMGKVNEKVDNLKEDVDEIKNDVKSISGKPGKRWDKLIDIGLGAFLTAIIVAFCKLILK